MKRLVMLLTTLCALVVVTVCMNLVLCKDTVWRRLDRRPV